jgi:hypothetical protein
MGPAGPLRCITILMTAFESNDELFQEYTKKQMINGFFQKPIRLHNLREEVNNQIHIYELQKQKSLIKYNEHGFRSLDYFRDSLHIIFCLLGLT